MHSMSIMKMKYAVAILLAALTLLSCKDEYKATTIQQELISDLGKMNDAMALFKSAIERNAAQEEILSHFKKCRLAYKKVEWALEYFVPKTARFMNGPPLDDIELEENRAFEPHGFQVMEELIYPEYPKENKKALLRELAVFGSNTKQVTTNIEAITVSNDYVLDALQQHVFRVLTLGVTGFDSPLVQLSVTEAGESLALIPSVLQKINSNSKNFKELKELTLQAQSYCNANADFNTFNRAEFITKYLNPVSVKLKAFQRDHKIGDVKRGSPVKTSATTLFDVEAFDVNGFILSKDYVFTNEKALLGEKLFYDTGLSKNNNRSCASCHNPDKAFTDGLKTNLTLSGGNLPRNTPTLTYASLQNAQFWDLRQLDLEKQSVDVLENTDEMHGSLKDTHKRLLKDDSYTLLFRKAFPKAKAIEPWHIQNAIASYVRSLNSFDSRFDKYMRGDASQLTAQEVNGMNIFMGKAKCATCHFTPLFNGTVPPNYAKTEHEVVGTPKNVAAKEISPDAGRYVYNKMPQLKGAFKTPTLRNVAVTAPYMHNGVYASLEEVIDFYNKGGGVGLGYTVDNQTLPFDSLKLTQKEQEDLVAFMKTLTDEKYEKQ